MTLSDASRIPTGCASHSPPIHAQRIPLKRAIFLLFAVCLTVGCQKTAAPAPTKAKKPIDVEYRLPVVAKLVEHEEFSGRLAAAEAVEIKARVSGPVEEVLFRDGDDVVAGQKLFRIDDRPYRAHFEHAQALVKQLSARVEKLKRQETRARRLLDMQSISQEDYDTAAFDLSEGQSALIAAEATRDLAELDLSYTEITARITGRISRHLVDPGNLVKADESSLARIVSLDPIHAYFDVDERTVLRLQRLIREGKISSARDHDISISVALADEATASMTARFNFINNEIDPATGTLLARAEIANPDSMLSPGMFVRLRVPIGEPTDVLLVPEEALGSDQGVRYLLVVGPENKVEYRKVEVGWRDSGQRVIISGITATDKVVVTNLQRIRPKDEVNPRERAAPGEESPGTTTTAANAASK